MPTDKSQNTASEPDNPPERFSEVFRQELRDVKTRRQQVRQDREWRGLPPDKAPTEEAEVQRLRINALDNDVVGLALSGGGIRSATFSLGVLQALAELRLLTRIDYLSTVSGGGFIGGWLAAWIKREGEVRNVERQLHPNRIDEARAKRWDGSQIDLPDDSREVPNQILDDEPEPVRHLRSYSNYLAPRPSLFSADGWVLIAIYLRNLLLNQFVFLLALLALLFAVDTSVKFCSFINHFHKDPLFHSDAALAVTSGGAIVAFIIVPMSIVCWSMSRSLRQVEAAGPQTSDQGSVRTARRRTHTLIMIPLLVTAYASCLASSSPWLGELLEALVRSARWLFGLDAGLHHLMHEEQWVKIFPGLVFSASFGLFHSLFNWRSYGVFGYCLLQLLGFGRGQGFMPKTCLDHLGNAARWIFSGFGAGAVGGFLFYLVLTEMRGSVAHPDCQCHSGVVSLGPPLFLAVFVLIGFVHVGIQGRLLSEAQREWWSSLGGWILMYAAGWTLVVGTVLYGPYLVLSLHETSSWWSPAILGSWIMSVAGGLYAGHGAKTGGDAQRQWYVEMITRFAPFLFLIGMLIMLALLAFTLIVGWPSDGDFYLKQLNSDARLGKVVILTVSFFFLALGAGWFVDVNTFSLQGLYSNRLIRCYLGASRRKSAAPSDRPGASTNSRGPRRNPNVLTGFDPRDDVPLATLQVGQSERQDAPGTKKEPVSPAENNAERQYWGPLLLINTTLNLVHGEELAWQERKAESFVLTPQYCGCLTTGYRKTAEYAGGLTLGNAMGISGAAVSPNMGFHSAPAVTALLTIFNARLGAWLGNPRNTHKTWRNSGPSIGLVYLLYEMLGRTDAHNPYVYLSDGGHFDNIGLYELVRRRCRFIIVCDAGADPNFVLEDLGNVIRKVRIDFGVRIDINIDVSGLKSSADGRAVSHVAFGKIFYADVDREPNDPTDPQAKSDPWVVGDREGLLVYLKPALTGDEPSDLANYKAMHPNFPHDSTVNQFFPESQFESYRALGYHSAKEVFREVLPGNQKVPDPRSNRELFGKLLTTLCPPPPNFTHNNLEMNQEYIAIQQALRDCKELRNLSDAIYSTASKNQEHRGDIHEDTDANIRVTERHMIAQMLTVLENTWFSLHLKRYRDHPIHNGWREVTKRWFAVPIVQENWKLLKAEFSHEFQEFIDTELIGGMSKTSAADKADKAKTQGD